MHNDLYFIPLLSRALDQPDPGTALQEAFEEIHRMGREQAYKEGFVQFREFMRAVFAHVGASLDFRAPNGAERAIALATETFEGDENERRTALGHVMAHPGEREVYTALRAALDAAASGRFSVELVVEGPGEIISEAFIERVPGSVHVEDIGPGPYAVKLASGRVLWEGVFREEDVLWARAFPGRPLEMAADSGDGTAPQPTSEFMLLGGEIIMRLFAGAENGYLEFEAQALGRKQ